MSFVFVSHAGSDKSTLTPLFKALLDAGVPLWIDRPADVGLDTHQLMMRGIGEGRVFDEEIRDALQNSACVLYFLSGRSCSPDRSDTLFREIDHGALNNKLVMARIEDIEVDAMPGLLRIRHSIDLSAEFRQGFAGANSDNFKRLVATLRKYVLQLDSNMGSRGLISEFPPDIRHKRFRTLLPYLCDRHSQQRKFVTRVQQDLDQPSGFPLHFFISGEDGQCADKFVELLNTVALPRLLKKNGLQNVVHQCVLRWPSGETGLDMETGLEERLEELKFGLRDRLMLRQTAEDHEIRNWLETQSGVLFMQFELDVHEWNATDKELIAAWFRWLATWRLTNRRYPTIVVVRLTYAAVFLRRLTARRRTKSVQSEIIKTSQQEVDGDRLTFLPELGNVSSNDVELWLRENQALANYDQERLGRRIRQYFSRTLGLRRRDAPMLDIARFLDKLLEEYGVELEEGQIGKMLG